MHFLSHQDMYLPTIQAKLKTSIIYCGFHNILIFHLKLKIYLFEDIMFLENPFIFSYLSMSSFTGTLPAGTEKTGTPFTGTELPIPIQPNSNASLCSDPSIDTIFQTAAGTSYVFRGESYWKLTSVSIASGYPRRIADDWKGLPNDIDAAFTWQLTDSTYFFSGVNYWKFKNWTADPKNPKSMAEGFPGIPNDVDTAFVWGGNNKMYFFKGNSYWMFDPERKPHVRSDLYPRNISEWDLPRDIEGAMQWSNGKTYFFKEGLYWRFNDVKFSVDLANPKFPRQTTQWWFGCQTTNLKYQSHKDVADEEVDVSN